MKDIPILSQVLDYLKSIYNQTPPCKVGITTPMGTRYFKTYLELESYIEYCTTESINLDNEAKAAMAILKSLRITEEL